MLEPHASHCDWLSMRSLVMRGSESKSVTSNPSCRRATSTPQPCYLRSSALTGFLWGCRDPATTATVEVDDLTAHAEGGVENSWKFLRLFGRLGLHSLTL